MARPLDFTRYSIAIKIGDFTTTLEAITGGALVRSRTKAITTGGGIVTNQPYGAVTCEFQCRLTTSQFNALVRAYEDVSLLPFGQNAVIHTQFLYSGSPDGWTKITTSFDHVTITAMPDVVEFDADGAEVLYNIGLSMIGGGAPRQETVQPGG